MAVDDFEAFRQKKLAEKQKAERDSMQSHYEFKSEEEGKAKGLVSHRRAHKHFSEDEIPKMKGFQSHIADVEVDPESIEKFGGKQLWGQNLPKVDPDSVAKIRGRFTHISQTDRVDPESIEKAAGLKRY